MTFPVGARKVHYYIGLVEQEPEIVELNIWFSADLGGTYPEHIDGALQAGAEAMASYLETAVPTQDVEATRYYEVHTQGDTWPAS